MASESTSPTSTGTRLAGKVAIVTGGGSGYGEGIALAFARESCTVIISDINETGGARVASSFPSQISFFKSDVTKAGDWSSLMEFATAASGGKGVDILVNNAGTSYRNKPTLDVTEDEFDRVMNVNVKSIYHSINAFVPPLLASGRGASIINISSIGSTRPRGGLVWYNASKGAVTNATLGLANEYGTHQIRVNAVCPLLGATGLFSHFTGEEDTPAAREKFVGNVPMGRLCEPEDVASACLWLASDESRFVTGVSINVDGGKTIG